MVAIVSFINIVILTLILGSVFRGQIKESHLSSCLAMLVAMTKSTLIGIIIAVWVNDIVFATIISILVSFLFVSIMTYQLTAKVFIECFGSLLMGAMMGSMLSLMTTKYELISILFFTFVYIISCLMATGLWNKEKYQNFFKEIPSKVLVISALTAILLAVTTIVDTGLFSSNEVETESENNHHHHNE